LFDGKETNIESFKNLIERKNEKALFLFVCF